jgi:hypothetical protein
MASITATDFRKTKIPVQDHPVDSPKKAKPFKRWFAMAGYERVQEIEGLELAQKRVKGIYNQKRVF